MLGCGRIGRLGSGVSFRAAEPELGSSGGHSRVGGRPKSFSELGMAGGETVEIHALARLEEALDRCRARGGLQREVLFRMGGSSNVGAARRT